MLIAGLSVVLFVGGFLLDFCTAKYNLAINHRDNDEPAPRGHAAAAWSVAMYGVGAAGLFAVVGVHPVLMIPEAAGLYAGTLYVAHRARRERVGRLGDGA